jgi:hypothetical protein
VLLQIRSKNLGSLPIIFSKLGTVLTFTAIICSPISRADVYTWVDGRFYVSGAQDLTIKTLSAQESSESPVAQISQGLFGDMVVNYYHDNLPYGSRIEILYGLGGTEQLGDGQPLPISWENGGSVEAKAIGPYVWSAHIAQSLAQYDGQRRYVKLEFCVRVTLPTGVVYDPLHCQPEESYLEAKIPWESVPQVDIAHAHWRRLPHAIKKTNP